MLGRGALANPLLPCQVAGELGLVPKMPSAETEDRVDSAWIPSLRRLIALSGTPTGKAPDALMLCRLKQWLNLAQRHGDFGAFDAIKRTESVEALFATLAARP